MTGLFKIKSDLPINTKADDKLNRSSFADRISDAIRNYPLGESIVLGLFGEWGSGKTSILNLVEQNIIEANQGKKKKQKDILIKFNPWNFTNQDQLLEQFFKFLQNELRINNYRDVLVENGEIYEKISCAAALFDKLPIIGGFARKISKLLSNYSKALTSFAKNHGLEQTKQKINKALSKQKRKIIIFIDDIDRLNDSEINQIFQLVKLVADFKNTIYVLAFDKEIAIAALKEEHTKKPEQYLEKIIQFPFIIPAVNKNRLKQILFDRLNSLIDQKRWQKNRDLNLHMSGIYDSFLTIRDINRFLNNFEFGYYALSHEVDIIDYIIIRYLEVFYFSIYKKIQNNKKALLVISHHIIVIKVKRKKSST